MKGKVVFILGCTPRSSTTATMKALSAHTQLHAPSMADLLLPKAPKIVRSGFEWIAPIVQPYFDSRWNPAIHATGFNKREAFDIAVMRKFQGEGVMGHTYYGLLNGKTTPTFTTQHLDFLEQIVKRAQSENPKQIPLLKYFGGIFHLGELKDRFPDAKFIFLQRNPEKAFTSYVTLLGNALKNEKLPETYWAGVYQMVVSAYALAQQVQSYTDILSLKSEEVSADMEKHVRLMLDYIGLPFEGQQALQEALQQLKLKWQERSEKGMGYTYTDKIAKALFKAEDFQ